MATPVLFPGNSNSVFAREITNPITGEPITDGACTWSLNTQPRLKNLSADPDNEVVATGTGTYTHPLMSNGVELDSDGDYLLEGLDDSLDIEFGESYWLIVRIPNSSGMYETETEVIANRRSGKTANT